MQSEAPKEPFGGREPADRTAKRLDGAGPRTGDYEKIPEEFYPRKLFVCNALNIGVLVIILIIVVAISILLAYFMHSYCKNCPRVYIGVIICIFLIYV